MKIRQISVFIENKTGRLYEVVRLLGNNNINIRALSLADTSDFGIIRFIVGDPDKAYKILKENEFTVGVNDVMAIAIPDKPGGLADVLQLLQAKSINVEYMYAFVTDSGKDAAMIFRFEDTDNVFNLIKSCNVKILEEKDLFNL